MKALAIVFFLAPAFMFAQTAKSAQPVQGPQAPPDTCVQCHSAMDGDIQKPALLIKNDVHIAAGLGCADCHGGDRTAVDPSEAMSKAKGFIGKPKRTAIPELCGRCHGDPNFMRKYRPQQRVDQLELYKTSIHGKRIAAGDVNAATCIDCHSVHDIRAVKDPMSPVYPPHIPDTCGHCHADAAKMAQYKIPTDQLAQYRTSVHWETLSKKGDLSAPTCASCHGNHGAKPPQAESVAAVCGTCHVLFAQNYNKSMHQPIFSGSSGGGCVVCHSNHGIHQPSTAMLAGSTAVCAPCHDAGSDGGKAAAQMAGWLNNLDAALKRSEDTLAKADKAGMEVSEAQVRLNEGRDDLVKARLAMHTFQPTEMKIPIDAGMKVAGETRAAGETALKEKDVRREWLAISVFFIALTMLAAWLVIRRMESNGAAYAETPAE